MVSACMRRCRSATQPSAIAVANTAPWRKARGFSKNIGGPFAGLAYGYMRRRQFSERQPFAAGLPGQQQMQQDSGWRLPETFPLIARCRA